MVRVGRHLLDVRRPSFFVCVGDGQKLQQTHPRRSLIECNMAIVCACMPSLRAVFNACFSSLPFLNRRRRTTSPINKNNKNNNDDSSPPVAPCPPVFKAGHHTITVTTTVSSSNKPWHSTQHGVPTVITNTCGGDRGSDHYDHGRDHPDQDTLKCGSYIELSPRDQGPGPGTD